ncbi:FAD-dependent monooxygenase [Methylobrevis albus]|uniref:FAD-dependent monooxygenase n=1 Tax=Methylobrevis albus TaxID=2793297 RepID=A0A931MYF2_9HYPH|nr:FAD-dependent monooxygenase [Methylobrevis albus]MBH0236994.1 FAD-dependent monooxygenase [Methylobrevis albus]
MADRHPVFINGAGIAGLTLALALARRGIASVVVERAGELAEVGAGIQISPNAAHVLVSLGLGAAIGRWAVRPEAVAIRSGGDGRLLARLPLGRQAAARFGAPYWTLLRADLQQALLAAVAAEPAVTLRLGASVTTVADDGPAMTVHWRDAAGDHADAAALLVGADGVWSDVRVRLVGGPPAAYSGRVAFRATIPMSDSGLAAALEPATATGLWLGTAAHFVHYPVHAGDRLNLVALVDDAWTATRWNTEATGYDIAPHFSGWAEPIRRLIAAPDTWRKWALCAVDPAGPWSKGRVVLIGDAAHAMLPFAAQGGAMAIEDAAVLARHVAAEADPTRAIAAYVAARRGRASRVAALARRNAAIYHLDGIAARGRDLGMRLVGGRPLAASVDWIYRWRDG